MFGLLNVSFNDSLLNITLEKYINHDFHTVKSFQISLDHSDPRAFFVFILYKANIFDKNHVYDSFLKKIYPDTVLKQIIGDALAAEIKTVDGMKEFLPAYIPKIEEFKEKLNAIEKRLKNIEKSRLGSKCIGKPVTLVLENIGFYTNRTKGSRMQLFR
ncbi:hypothetical protein LUQ84_000172 [Hamiltosporidium tvaerminnensis]|nr:hypothetical protein LUQ84_000172 [Hamiltosporidium tvaerminnensis]